MIKVFILARRTPGLTRQAAQAHLRDVHGRMVVLPPADAGALPAYYVQNHIVDGGYPAGDGAQAIERDLVTEVNFESMAAMQAALATPYYLEKLGPDEPRFVHNPSVVRLAVVPQTIVEGSRTFAKLFVFVSRTPDLDDARWTAIRDGVGETMRGWDGLVALTENVVAPPPHGQRFVDSVFEAWFDGHAAAMDAASRVPALFAVDGIDRDRSLTVVAEEYTEERLRALLTEQAKADSRS
ncbi:hypothetical protein ASG11_10910 [Sphingomonas sp. Leaf357]|uniref:EthD domain-containing protein n=1 Tax=Sphingomonas sp. Leaf357 TaxID=1736350 RepID=UPI000700572D|nr:EthD domain-containing protein [Sphingomonas sp. Leaf357]KQS04695.1 hypothetical protein ASG11_10910 [Sphingomonas sp. Leaf357]